MMSHTLILKLLAGEGAESFLKKLNNDLFCIFFHIILRDSKGGTEMIL